jgi:hypothetical protein
MADPPLDSGSTTGTPRWVKVFGITAVLVVLVVVVLLVFGGGEHGPSRHSLGSATIDTAGSHTGPPFGSTHGE